MKKQLYLRAIAAALVIATAVGCATQPTAPKAEAPLKVAITLPGSIDDGSWNAGAYNGLKAAAEKYGLEMIYSENVPKAQIEQAYRDYAGKGYDLIIGHGFEFGDPAIKVAKDFPNTKWLIINGGVEAPNVASYFLRESEAYYVAGALGAMVSKTGKIGFVGGWDLPPMIQAGEAYKLGAKSMNPNIVVYDVYVGSWDDVAKGKEAAMAMINNGADVLAHLADSTGFGMIQACQEKGAYAIGFSYDQNPMAPDTVLTSVVSNFGKIIDTGVSMILENKWEGKVYEAAVHNKMVDLMPYHGLDSKVPQDVKDKVNQIIKDIEDGKLEVPMISTQSN